MSSAERPAASCPYCGEPKDRHEYASRTSCVLGAPKPPAANEHEQALREYLRQPGVPVEVSIAFVALVNDRNRYRTALETIKRTTKSGGAEAIAREALS